MEAASRGVGGRRWRDRRDARPAPIATSANQWVTVAIPTGLGELRNGLIVRAADAVIAVGGAYGTLSEVALALKTGVPVVGLETWEIAGIEAVGAPAVAVARAVEEARAQPSSWRGARGPARVDARATPQHGCLRRRPASTVAPSTGRACPRSSPRT